MYLYKRMLKQRVLCALNELKENPCLMLPFNANNRLYAAPISLLMAKKIILLLLVQLIALCCFAQYTYTLPKSLSDGWETGDIRDQLPDSSRLYALFNQLASEENRIHSVLLIRYEKLILEEYLNRNSADELHDMRSATKSIISLLMGIAVDKGFVKSVDDPISTYLPDLNPQKNLDPRKADITIRHLLTMSTGLDCNDWDKKSKGQEDKVYRKKDWLQYTMDLPMLHEAGEVSAYCTMGVVLTAEIIQRASGIPLDQFARQHLFEPLGITHVKWGHTSDKEVILAGKRLYMRPRDMAKLGQLVLNKGKWGTEQLVSKAWIQESTQPTTQISGVDYGHLWWNIPFKWKDGAVLSVCAMGNGGQYIMILPELNLVAVFTGGAYNSADDKLPFAIMNQVFLPDFAN